MKSLHVRDLDEATISALKRLAQRHHRSLQGELRAILTQAAELAGPSDQDDFDLITTNTGRTGSWSREDIYDDRGR